MIPRVPEEHPNTQLTLSAYVALDRQNARSKYPTADELRTQAKYLHGAPADRLAAAFVIEDSECWRWTKGLTSQGYGHFSIRGSYYQAHVLTYILHVGPPPAGLEPDHLCRNRWCVNPAHVEWVTHAVNMQRAATTVLSRIDVDAIRSEHRRGVGVRVLGRKFGVNHSTVSRIVNGLLWPDGRAKDAEAAA